MGVDTDMQFCHMCNKPVHTQMSCLWKHIQKRHPEDRLAARLPADDLPSDDQLLSLLRRRSEMGDDMLKDVSSKVNGVVEILKDSLEVKLNEQVAAKVKEEVKTTGSINEEVKYANPKDFWGKNLSKKDIRTWAKKVAKRDYPAMRKLLGVPKGKTMPGMPELGDGLS